MAATDGRRAPGAAASTMGQMGTFPSPFSTNSSSRLFSASLIGPGVGGRARATTQEIIAEAFGRRLHGLELLSVKKLNALNASAAKLEAHVASRAAAISRTSVVATTTNTAFAEAGPGLGTAGTSGLGAAAKAATAAAAATAGEGEGEGAATGGASGPAAAAVDGEAEPMPQQLSLVISVAFPATGLSTSPQQQQQSTGGSQLAKQGGAGAGAAGTKLAPPDIAERGAQVVRLLALQDKILYGALGGAVHQQSSLLASQPSTLSTQSTSTQSQSQLQLTLLSPTTGTRFTVLPPAEQQQQQGGAGGGEGCGGVLSADEQRRLDLLGIKLDSKVAGAALKLYRLSPRGTGPGDTRSDDVPTTPPNTLRVRLPDLGTADEVSETMLGQMSPDSRRQLARSREFATMARFMQSLQDGDELSLARQARNFAHLNSSAPSQSSLSAALQTSPSPSLGAPVALPALSPPRPHTQPQFDSLLEGPSPGGSPYAPPPLEPQSSLPFATKINSHPPKHLTLEVPHSPIAGCPSAGALGGIGGWGGSMSPWSHSPGARSFGGASSSSRLQTTPRRVLGISLQEDVGDFGPMSGGQGRSNNLLDGLMKAVEMFVGAGPGGRATGSVPGQAAGGAGGGGGGDNRPRVRTAGTTSTGRESLLETSTAAAAVVAAAAGAEEGSEVAAAQGPTYPVPTYSGVFGSPERLTDRVRKKGALAVLTNPAGFREEVAAGEVALYREVASRCRTALARTALHPRDALMAADLQHLVANLHYCRPYFVAPRETLPELTIPLRPVSACSVSRQNTHYAQSAPRESVFLPRAEESEAEDIIDTTAIRERQVRKDWNRVVRKDAFRGLVGLEDPGAASGTTGLGHSLDACLAVVLRHKDSLKAVFTYYSMQSGSINDYCFALGLNEWRAFIADCGFGASNGDGGGRSSSPSNIAATAAALAAAAGPSGPTGRVSLFGRGALPGVPPPPQKPTAATGVSALAGGGGGRASKTMGATTPGKPPGASGGSATRAPTTRGRSISAVDGAAGVGGGGGGSVGTWPGGGRLSIRGGPQLQGYGLAAAAAAAAAGSGGAAAAAAGAASGTAGGGSGGSGSGPSSCPPPSNQLADAVFAAVNVEPEKRLVEGQVVLSRCLLRFEWYESLLRLAAIRHVKGGEKFGSIAAALEHMWTKEVLSVLPSAAVHEPNMWRIVRLYGDPEVNELFITHMDLITALYGLFSAASKNQMMHLSDWVGLLNTCAIIGDATGVTLHAAKLAYSRSLCVVVDEPSHWSRAVCLSRCDFMEALARLAEELAPPPLEEVAEAMREVGITGRRLRVALEQPWTYYYNELPVELLVARRLAAAEAAAAARCTSTGELDSTLPSVQSSTTRLDMGGALPTPTPLGATATISGPPSPGPGHPPLSGTGPPSSWNSLPKLSFRLEALLELLFGRLRDHWECGDNQQLTARLTAIAMSLQSAQ